MLCDYFLSRRSRWIFVLLCKESIHLTERFVGPLLNWVKSATLQAMSSGQMLLCARQMWKVRQSINYSGHRSSTGNLAPIHWWLHQGAVRTEPLANVDLIAFLPPSGTSRKWVRMEVGDGGQVRITDQYLWYIRCGQHYRKSSFMLYVHLSRSYIYLKFQVYISVKIQSVWARTDIKC